MSRFAGASRSAEGLRIHSSVQGCLLSKATACPCPRPQRRVRVHSAMLCRWLQPPSPAFVTRVKRCPQCPPTRVSQDEVVGGWSCHPRSDRPPCAGCSVISTGALGWRVCRVLSRPPLALSCRMGSVTLERCHLLVAVRRGRSCGSRELPRKPPPGADGRSPLPAGRTVRWARAQLRTKQLPASTEDTCPPSAGGRTRTCPGAPKELFLP